MDKILNQEELKALLQMVERRRPHSPNESAEAVPWDFRQAGTFSKDELHVVRSLHDTFARVLTNSLGSHLRGAFRVGAPFVEQIRYSEFAGRMPDQSYVASITVHPMKLAAAIGIDLQLAFPVIDMLLGGGGSSIAQVREVTEIEEEVLESLVELICGALEDAWLPALKLEFHFARRLDRAQFVRLMAPGEKVLAPSFEVSTAESHGMLNLAIPAAVVNALLKDLSQQGPAETQTGGPSLDHQLRNRLEGCCFHAELVSPTSSVSAGKLLLLEVGQVLEFPMAVADPTLFKVENQTLFLASPVAVGDRRAAEIHRHAVASKLTQEELS